jgi:lipopolysaccharide export system protein LptC
MKRLILSMMFVAGAIGITNSQSTIDNAYNCVNSHFTNLTQCFESNDVTGRYSGGANTLYFQADAGVTYTQVSTCVDNYNKDRVSCPTAPLLLLGTSQKSKKTVL